MISGGVIDISDSVIRYLVSSRQIFKIIIQKCAEKKIFQLEYKGAVLIHDFILAGPKKSYKNVRCKACSGSFKLCQVYLPAEGALGLYIDWVIEDFFFPHNHTTWCLG